MNVYYGMNFWGCMNPDVHKILMHEIKLGKEFTWGKLTGFIPAVYVGNEGIAIDFCIRISNDAVQSFVDKWQSKMENSASAEELEEVANENPLRVDFNLKLYVNGTELENDFACGTAYSSIIAKEYSETGVEKGLMEAYACDEKDAWYFKRHMCKWENMPASIHILDIDLIAENKEFCCEKIEIGLNSIENTYELIHPFHGNRYKLCVNDVECQVLDKEILNSMRRRKQNQEYPSHYITLTYDIFPEISQKQFQLQDTYKYKGDGATSIFIVGKNKKTQGNIAISFLRFEEFTSTLWKPVFLEKEWEDMRLHIEIQ